MNDHSHAYRNNFFKSSVIPLTSSVDVATRRARPVLIEEEHRIGMHDFVGMTGRLRRHAVGDAIAARQIGQFIGGSPEAVDLRREGAHIALEQRDRVAIRIHGHEQHPNIAGPRAKLLQSIGEVGQRCRAYVRAVRVAEIKDDDLAAIVRCMARSTVVGACHGKIERRHGARNVGRVPGRLAACREQNKQAQCCASPEHHAGEIARRAYPVCSRLARGCDQSPRKVAGSRFITRL